MARVREHEAHDTSAHQRRTEKRRAVSELVGSFGIA